MMGVLLTLAACGGTASDTTSTNPGGGSGSTSLPTLTQPPSNQDPGGGLQGVDVDVTNGVAPYDHQSLIDSLLIEIAASRLRTLEMNECMTDEGFGSQPAFAMPDRDDPSLVSNAAFPNIDKLSRDGFVRAESNAPPPDGSPQPAPGELEALSMCAARLETTGSDSESIMEVFFSVRGAWEQVLAEVDALPEVRALVEAFSSCLRDDGVPAESAASEIAFLSYVDVLFLGTTDAESQREIDRRLGRLYAECGRELFGARERLRSGELRDAFLSRHESAIRELDAMLFGAGVSD